MKKMKNYSAIIPIVVNVLVDKYEDIGMDPEVHARSLISHSLINSNTLAFAGKGVSIEGVRCYYNDHYYPDRENLSCLEPMITDHAKIKKHLLIRQIRMLDDSCLDEHINLILKRK